MSGAKICKSYRSREELSNKHLLAKIGFGTAENEPPKVTCKFSISSLRVILLTCEFSTTCKQANVQVFHVSKSSSHVILKLRDRQHRLLASGVGRAADVPGHLPVRRPDHNLHARRQELHGRDLKGNE